MCAHARVPPNACPHPVRTAVTKCGLAAVNSVNTVFCTRSVYDCRPAAVNRTIRATTISQTSICTSFAGAEFNLSAQVRPSVHRPRTPTAAASRRPFHVDGTNDRSVRAHVR